MKPTHSMPTPYGVMVPVVHAPTKDDPDHFLFDMDSTAKLAGIYDINRRREFAEASKHLGHVPPFQDFGGHKVPRLHLPRPLKPAYPGLPEAGNGLPIEAWVTRAMDHHRWCDRADALAEVIDDNMDQMMKWRDVPVEIGAMGLSTLLTATLEHLTESEIDCLEAAAFYALTQHDEWRAPAVQWLQPFAATWFRDWIADRPDYPRFASIMRRVHDDIPSWIAGEAR